MTEEYYSYIKGFFNKWARYYDIAVMPLAGIRKKVVAMTGAAKGARILDVCAGTGQQAFAFAKMGYSVIGIDLSEEMLKVATKHNKYPNLKLETGDAAKMPYADSSFDVACVSYGLHEMPAEIWHKVVKEMVRVTRPGGTIVVVDYALPENKISRFFIDRFINLYESKYYRQFIKADLPAFLSQAGIIIEAEKSVMLHAAKIFKGRRVEG